LLGAAGTLAGTFCGPRVGLREEGSRVPSIAGSAGRFSYRTVELVVFESDAITFAYLSGPFLRCHEWFQGALLHWAIEREWRPPTVAPVGHDRRVFPGPPPPKVTDRNALDALTQSKWLNATVPPRQVRVLVGRGGRVCVMSMSERLCCTGRCWPGFGGWSYPEAGSGTGAPTPVLRIRDPTRVEGEAPASDAFCQPFTQALELGGLLINSIQPLT
jgi:hypothetical protein